MLFGGMFGGHHQMPPAASSTPMHGDMHEGTTTQGWNGHMGSSTPWQNGQNGSTTPGHVGMMVPGIFGTVTSINGESLTVAGHGGPNTATTTYTVDATNAKILKAGAPGSKTAPATITVSSIQINDSVAVTGTVSGTNVTAKTIIDGIMPRMMGMNMGGRGPMPGSQDSGPNK